MTSIVKTMIIHHLPDSNDFSALERWFWQHHCHEVLLQVPWIKRYVMYRAVLMPPPEVEAFGYFNYRVHENWVGTEGRRGINGTLSMTPQPGKMEVVIVSVPAEPTEDFMGAELRYGEKTILRWLTVFRYPDGVSLEEGEQWYLNVHVPEVMQQQGLIRFLATKRYQVLHYQGIRQNRSLLLPIADLCYLCNGTGYLRCGMKIIMVGWIQW